VVIKRKRCFKLGIRLGARILWGKLSVREGEEACAVLEEGHSKKNERRSNWRENKKKKKRKKKKKKKKRGKSVIISSVTKGEWVPR